MKKRIVVSLSIVITTSSLLMTACGNNKNDTVSAMNNVSTETESIVESSTEIESSIETETETQSETESTTEIETQDATESSTETETQDTTESTMDTSATTYTTTPTTGVMYATIDAYTYEGPDIESYEIKATVQEGEQVSIIGRVNEANWYEIEQEGSITSFISADFLTTTDPNPSPAPATNSTPQTAQNTQPQQQATTQPQQTQTPEQSQQQAPQQVQQTTPPANDYGDTEPFINPATGQEYQPGDVLSDGKTIYAGDFNHDDTW